MKFRPAELHEINTLVQLRKRQLMDEGSAANDAMDETLPAYFQKMMSEGSLVEWICEDKGEIIATSAIIFYPLPPSFEDPAGLEGYIANMYTAPAYRGRGIAGKLLSHLMEEARARNVSVVRLRTSDQGRSVYEKFGFLPSEDWMMIEP